MSVTNVNVTVDQNDVKKLTVTWEPVDPEVGPTDYLVCASEQEDTDSCRFNETAGGKWTFS